MAGSPNGGRGVTLGDIKDDGAVGLDGDGRFGIAQGELDRVRAVIERVFAQQPDSSFVG